MPDYLYIFFGIEAEHESMDYYLCAIEQILAEILTGEFIGDAP